MPVARTIADIPRTWSALDPHRPCVSTGDVTRSWLEVYERSARVGRGLVELGLQPQDRVAFLAKNTSEWVEVLFGAAMAGSVAVPVSWRLPGTELAAILEDCCARVLFVEHAMLETVEAMRAELTHVEEVVVIGVNGAGSYEHWLSQHRPHDPQVCSDEGQDSGHLYTSGTTGAPKGAVFSTAAVRTAYANAPLFDITGESAVLVGVPVFHAFGFAMVLKALASGGHTVFSLDAGPSAVATAVERHGVTVLALVPVIIKRLLAGSQALHQLLSTVERIVYAGSPISSDLLSEAMDKLGCSFMQIYGMTETVSVTFLSPEDHRERGHPWRRQSAGRPFPGVHVRVADPLTGRELDEGAVGEICVRSPTAMSGYWRRPHDTAVLMTEDGFVRTGDVGLLRDGYLVLIDRLKDVIVSGGENVHPTEVERVLLSHPGVADVVVVGVPSQLWGESIKAVVVRESDHLDVADAELMEFAREELARYKCPTSVEFVADLPRNSAGKLLRRTVREVYWHGMSRKIN